MRSTSANRRNSWEATRYASFELYLLNEKKLAPGTVEGRMSALRFLYKKVLKRRDIAYDDLIFPKIPRKLPVVLSPEEVTRMIEAAPNLLHRTILMVLYATGIRRTEASLLKVSDIDSERMVIHIHQGKGSRDRDVPMTPKLLEALREYFRWKRPKVYLFPSTAGHRGVEQPLSDHTIWYICSEAAKRAGIKKTDRRAHDSPQLRHNPDGGRNRPADDSASDGPRTPGTHHGRICTCRNVTCMPLRTHSIRSRLVARASRESGRTAIRHDTATLGGGRYHPQGGKQIHRTLSRFADVGATQSAPGDRALPHGRAGWAS